MNWVSILKCPITGQDLRLLNKDEISILATKDLWQVDGESLKEKIEDGLITLDTKYIYPIINGIILLLKDLAIVDLPDKILGEGISKEKKLVKDFYDNRGWQTTEKGDYEDADIFEDLRPVSAEYLKKCHDRVSKHLKQSGEYMLDAASGALQYEDYLQYSANYSYRVCIDLSFRGLVECKRKLGAKAICILGDITKLPIKSNSMDGFISLNTIYHIPKDEQIQAIKELHRVLDLNCKGVVVYDWYKHSRWMNLTLLPFRAYEYFRQRLRRLFSRVNGKGEPTKMLYFYTHPYSYFVDNLPFKFELAVWRSVSVPFMKVYIHSWFFGKQILRWLYKQEELNPEKFGLNGEYPMMVFEKSEPA
ncbi:MAG: methyltransferase domain-containing protein [Cyclobacteriaceae bacterium]